LSWLVALADNAFHASCSASIPEALGQSHCFSVSATEQHFLFQGGFLECPGVGRETKNNAAIGPAVLQVDEQRTDSVDKKASPSCGAIVSIIVSSPETRMVRPGTGGSAGIPLDQASACRKETSAPSVMIGPRLF